MLQVSTMSELSEAAGFTSPSTHFRDESSHATNRTCKNTQTSNIKERRTRPLLSTDLLNLTAICSLYRDTSRTYFDPESSLEAAGKEATKWTDHWCKQWQRNWMKDERICSHRLPVTANLNITTSTKSIILNDLLKDSQSPTDVCNKLDLIADLLSCHDIKTVATFKQPWEAKKCLKARVSERTLHSSTAPLLDKRFTRTDFANRAFRCSAPTVWNSLPETIIRCDSLSRFNSKLKTYFFHEAFD